MHLGFGLREKISTKVVQNNFRLFQTERVCRHGGKFSKRVENTAGKGEIARYEQFLLFPQCFQKT